MDRKKGSGKENRCHAILQIGLEVHCRIHTEKPDHKSAVIFQLTVDHIIFVHNIMYIYKRTHLEIQIQNLFPLLFICRPFQIRFHLCQKVHELQRNMRYAGQDLIILTFSFQCKKQLVDSLKLSCQSRGFCTDRPLQFQKILLIKLSAVHFSPAFYQVVSFVNQKDIVTAAAF